MEQYNRERIKKKLEGRKKQKGLVALEKSESSSVLATTTRSFPDVSGRAVAQQVSLMRVFA